MKIEADDIVLIVDDIKENRILAKLYLEKLGWRVLEANSGLSAIELLKTVAAAQILLDVKMPGIDGLSVARFVRHDLKDSNVKIVGYTAHALYSEVEEILLAGFDSVLIKPITYDDIVCEFGRLSE